MDENGGEQAEDQTGSGSAPRKPSQSEPETQHGTDEAHYEKRFFKGLRYWLEIAAIPAGLVIVVLTCEQVQLSRESLEIVNRARLIVVETAGSVILEPGATEGSFRIKISNTGKLPAEHVIGVTNSKYFPASIDFPMPPSYPAPVNGKASVTRIGEGLSIEPDVIIGPYSEPTIELIRQGQLILYVFGRYEYQDGFGQARFLTFCGYLNPASHHLTICPVYNDGD